MVLRVEVSDTGCGIPADQMPKLFEPLFTTKGDAGNGLGLSVCKTIVESYGGRISIRYQPGTGTCVTICFSKTT